MKPGPPVNFEVIDFSKDSVTLTWNPPLDTGRGKIFGYMLEFQKAGEEEWSKVRHEAHRIYLFDFNDLHTASS